MKIGELLDSPAKWTVGANARDQYGEHREANDADAVCWCLRGALVRCYRGSFDALAERDEIQDRLCGYLGVSMLHEWNDAPERTFADVRALVERLDI